MDGSALFRAEEALRDGPGDVDKSEDRRRDESGGRAAVGADAGDHQGGEPLLETPELRDRFQNERGIAVRLDRGRDAKLTAFGKATLADRYLLPGESFQDLFARVAAHFADDSAHAQRLYDYISKLWFMPATPVLSNGGTDRGLPISCFLNEAADSLEGIVDLWNENVWLAARGGGIGSYWGNLRSIGEKVGLNGKTSGVLPFIRVMDSLTLAISQGSLRRGSAAVYLPVSHPEIEEFIELRRPTGGDPNRKALNLHHGVVIPDAFMRAVEADGEWALKSPKDGHVVKRIGARSLWIRILTARIETGEPYLIFVDQVNRALPEHQKLAGPRGQDVQPLQRDHAADRTRPARPGAYGRLLPLLAQPRYLFRVGGRAALHRGHHALPRQRSERLHRARARLHGAGPLLGGARALGRPRRDGLPLLPAEERHPHRRRHGQGLESPDLQVTSAARPTPPRASWPPSAAPARMRPSWASRSASPTSWRSRPPPRSRSSAAAPRRGSSRPRPTASPTRRCPAPSTCATHTWRRC